MYITIINGSSVWPYKTSVTLRKRYILDSAIFELLIASNQGEKYHYFTLTLFSIEFSIWVFKAG
jgi:hypothetical protein